MGGREERALLRSTAWKVVCILCARQIFRPLTMRMNSEMFAVPVFCLVFLALIIGFEGKS